MKFNFIHAADLHLDSPLTGLSFKSPAFAHRIEDASRLAFDNLIALAIEEDCRFILIAGDIFDGQWRDYRTGLFFADRMRRLQEADISVLVVLGNHDAENRFVSRLELPPNVGVFSQRRPDSFSVDGLDVVIHGRSFPQREVTDNIALDYPQPAAGMLNIGLLHTACNGREGHAHYAPCTVEQLARHGYDYWALGHVHEREVLATDPYIVFPGNLQGRNPREAGAKGVTLVRVENGRICEVLHRPVDVVRWAMEALDVSTAKNIDEIHALIKVRLERAYARVDGRSLALRLRLTGETGLHHDLVIGQTTLDAEVQTVAAGVAEDLWVEKLELDTRPPRRGEALDPTIAGKLRQAIEQLRGGDALAASLEARLAEIRVKLPAAAHVEELFATLQAQAPARAVDLALSLIERGLG